MHAGQRFALLVLAALTLVLGGSVSVVAYGSPAVSADQVPPGTATVPGTDSDASAQVVFPECPLPGSIQSAIYIRRSVAELPVDPADCPSDVDGSGGPADAIDAQFVLRSLAGLVPLGAMLSPASAAAGSAGFVLTVDGSGFFAGSKVFFDGEELSTTFVSDTRLTAQVTTANIAFEGDVSVVVVLPAGGESNTLAFELTPGLDSYELIDAAVTAATIPAETGFLYKLFADTGDSRLPLAYRSNVLREEATAFAGLPLTYGTLSPGMKAQVAPFLLPADAPGSWFYLRQTPAPLSVASATTHSLSPACSAVSEPASFPDPSWHAVDGPHVTVWWHSCAPSDQAKAQAVQSAINGTIWPKLTGLMGTPVSDLAVPNHGNNGNLDIRIVPGGSVSTQPYGDTCPAAAHITLGDGAARLYANYTVTRALMRALQFRFERVGGCAEQPNWLDDSTAVWAQDYVYPSLTVEHKYARAFMEAPDQSLDAITSSIDNHGYGVYLWWFFLQRQYGASGAESVRDIYTFLHGSSELNALKDALPENMATLWPKFTLYNWNHYELSGPVNKYWTWDKLKDQVAPPVTLVELDGASSRAFPLDNPTPHLSASYYYLAVGVDVKLLSYSFAPGNAYTNVQVLWRTGYDGPWRLGTNHSDDWTELENVGFCTERPGQDITDLVVIVSNSSTTSDVIGEPPLITARDTCGGWQGTFSYRQVITSPGQAITMEGSGSLVFLGPATNSPDILGLVSSSATAFIERQTEECTASLTQSGPIVDLVDDFLWIIPYDPDIPGLDPLRPAYFFSVLGTVGSQVSVPCGDHSELLGPITLFFTTPQPGDFTPWSPELVIVSADGDLAAGEATNAVTSGPSTITYEVSWDFTRCSVPGVWLPSAQGPRLPFCEI